MNGTRRLNWFEDLKSIACRAGLQGVIIAVGIAAMCAYTHAATITLSAVQDTTIFDRPSSGGQRDQNFDGTGLQIWNNASSNSTNGRRRDIVFQFDLSTLPANSTIVSARLRYYDTGAGDYNGNNNIAFTNQTSLLTYDKALAADVDLRAPGTGTGAGGDETFAFSKLGMLDQFVTFTSTGTSATGLDRATSAWVGQWYSFETPAYKAANPDLDASSMNLSLDAGNAGGQYYNAGFANAGTLSRLNYAKDQLGFALFISDYVSTGGRSFGQSEGPNANPILLELEVVPEPASTILALIGGVGVIGLLRRRAGKN